jgi:hypothetical protein
MSTTQIPLKSHKVNARLSEQLRKPLNIIVGFLCLIGVGAVISLLFVPPISPVFHILPLITFLHVLPAGLWMVLAPFQFVKRIRSRWLNYHRWTGRLLVTLGLLIGLSALFMAWITPIAGWGERLIMAIYGPLFLVSLGKSFYHIRNHQVIQHREWMIRAFALTLAVSTVRLIEIPLLITVGLAWLQVVYIISNLTAFTSHLLVAEIWIRITRRKRAVQQNAQGVPALSSASH